jgi:hypothetical protein
MVDCSLFPTAGEISRRADAELDALLEPLRPLTWEKVAHALKGRKWVAHATFDMSSEVGDYIIHVPGSFMGFRTYPDGIEPMEGYYVRPEEVGTVTYI